MAFSPPDREHPDKPPAPGQRVAATLVMAPNPLHEGFDPTNVGVWDSDRFKMVKKLQDATRNRGMVHLMHDNDTGVDVAVKQMPNGWFRNSHQEFVAEHPTETEMPWQDIGCVNFLNHTGYAHSCDLLGVYKDIDFTYVVTSFASEGDMFSWCESGVSPGPERETVVRPLARQMLEGVQQLHEMGIGHLDLSLENVLMSKAKDGRLSIRIIDFGMATNSRYLKNCVRGKASYQAPELHTSQRYDAFLSDAFSIGVTLYAVLVKDYPWLSTRPGGCKCFEYVRKHGFRSYLDKRKLRNSQLRVGQILSEPLKQLLEGLMALDPAERLTLGEAAWASSGGSCATRGSVWDEPWLHG
jgi:serine/threonine protein kinase